MKFLLLSSILILLNNTRFTLQNQIEVIKFFKNKIEFENGMVIEIPLEKLKINYPGLTSQLLKQTTTKHVKNNFLFYNNNTRKFEGVSIQTTFNSFKNVTLITTSTSVIPTRKKLLNQLPLFNQFIYTIKTTENSYELLNEQSEFSSKLRLSLIKEISRNFGLNYTTLKLNWVEPLLNKTIFRTDKTEYILVSLSNVHILNLQKIYLNLFNENNENKIDQKFHNECESFYNDLRVRHTVSDNLLNIQKVQFIKLCNLTQIKQILDETDETKQLKMSQKLIKSNTEDFNWTQEEDETVYDDSSNDTVIITSLKSFSNSTQPNSLASKFELYYEQFKQEFWKVVPEEDFFIAVVVPFIIIISVLVLTIVIVCMLQMCKRQPVSDSKHLISSSNTTESTYHSKTFERMNPLYKEKAYLSKGVPVILYEEMSDKPIEELDENDADNTGSCTSNYRSPLILKNEKPPVPAPPEYTRPAYYAPQIKPSESILNELQSMLQQSANIISLAETPKELSPTKSIKSNSSTNTPFQFIQNEENIVLISNRNNKNTSSIIRSCDKRFNH